MSADMFNPKKRKTDQLYHKTNKNNILNILLLTCAGFSHFFRKSSLALARNSFTRIKNRDHSYECLLVSQHEEGCQSVTCWITTAKTPLLFCNETRHLQPRVTLNTEMMQRQPLIHRLFSRLSAFTSEPGPLKSKCGRLK